MGHGSSSKMGSHRWAVWYESVSVFVVHSPTYSNVQQRHLEYDMVCQGHTSLA